MPSSFCIRGLAIATLLLAGCSEDTPAPGPDAPPAASLPGVWAGTFPCENCSGIDTQLVLRPDGVFLFAQTDAPAAEDVPKPVTAYSLGHWSWDPGARLLTLFGRGPSRVFARPAADELVMQTASPLEHRLAKRNGSTEFTRSLPLEGTVRRAGDRYVFHECLTGYEVTLEEGGDYRRFQRQWRSVVSRGDGAPVMLVGRFAWRADGTPASLRIDKLVTIRAQGGCS